MLALCLHPFLSPALGVTGGTMSEPQASKSAAAASLQGPDQGTGTDQALDLSRCIVGALGISFLGSDPMGASEPGAPGWALLADMPVDERTCQPYGYLSGGASLALAETLAGYGSALFLPATHKPVGVTVSANHVSAAPVGHTVQGRATLVHKGRTTHVWNVDITDTDTGRLISTARVLNQILPVL